MAKQTTWLWPDRAISKAESRTLREEHNALANAHARLLAAADDLLHALNPAKSDDPERDKDVRTILAYGSVDCAVAELLAAAAVAQQVAAKE